MFAGGGGLVAVINTGYAACLTSEQLVCHLNVPVIGLAETETGGEKVAGGVRENGSPVALNTIPKLSVSLAV